MRASDQCSETREECGGASTEAKTDINPDTGGDEDADKGDSDPAQDKVEEEDRCPVHVCANCGQQFHTRMGLNFHHIVCVPDELFDEIPAEILEGGQCGHQSRSQRLDHPGSSNIFSDTPDQHHQLLTNNEDLERKCENVDMAGHVENGDHVDNRNSEGDDDVYNTDNGPGEDDVDCVVNERNASIDIDVSVSIPAGV